MKKCRLLFFLLIASATQAQNLVPNGSFETYQNCPEDYNLSTNCNWFHGPENWFQPSCATPDYYNSCSKSFGPDMQTPRTGKAYVGCYAFFPSAIKLKREYISIKLDSVLQKDQTYSVKFFVSLKDNSLLEIQYIGLYFSARSPQTFDDVLVLPFTPQIVNTNGFLANDSGWIEISGSYKAIGGERYITIGDFWPDANTEGKQREVIRSKASIGNSAYYFIDDVSIVPSGVLPKPIVLKNIFFAVGKSELLPKSFPELNKLAGRLKTDLKSKIEISGHTDNSGNEADNIKLSEARAKAVMEYLVSKGIAKDRISFKGYGSSKPVALNDTEKHKQSNRRVEFILQK